MVQTTEIKKSSPHANFAEVEFGSLFLQNADHQLEESDNGSDSQSAEGSESDHSDQCELVIVITFRCAVVVPVVVP